MGPTNTLETFMQTINNLLIDILAKKVVLFLDDILIYCYTAEEYFKPLKKVFICLQKHTFFCKLKKCSFFQKTTIFLGFNITLEGIHISDPKIRSLKEWPKPTIIQYVQLFLGFV